jgi:hypothetical protein
MANKHGIEFNKMGALENIQTCNYHIEVVTEVVNPYTFLHEGR